MKKIATTIACVMAIAGCAVPPVNFSVQNVVVSRAKIEAELKSITVMFAQPDEKSGAWPEGKGRVTPESVLQNWQASLTDALSRKAIFLDDSQRKVSLSVKVLKMELTNHFPVTMDAEAKYEIIDRKTGDVIFSRVIPSSGVVPFEFAAYGVARSREAINRAVQANIVGFLNVLEDVKIQ